MRKLNTRLLSMLTVLIMVISILSVNVFAANETDVLEGWSITLGDDIGVKFYLNSADYTVSATVNGAAVTPTISEKVATVNVAAAQMNDTIVLTVKNGEETVHTDEYSVRMYADTILNGSYDAEVKEMVLQMLHYGAAAQTYFGHNIGNLANAGYEDTFVEGVIPEAAATEMSISDDLNGLSFYGASLVFKSKIAIRYYFTGTGDIASYTFTAGGNTYSPVQKDSLYYVEVSGINPDAYDTAVEMTVSNDSGELTVSYSPMNYIIRMYEKGSEELKPLLKALCAYYEAAKAYRTYEDIVVHTTFTAGSYPMNVNAVYGNVGDNSAPVDAYKATSAENIQLIRGGETLNIGVVGRVSIEKRENDCLIKVNSDCIGDYAPLQENDVLIFAGDFVNSSGDKILRVATAYIHVTQAYADGINGTAVVSDTMPILPVTIECGSFSGTAMNANAVYASAAANDAPVAGYTVTAAENIKLIRSGETLNIGVAGRVAIEKRENDYLLMVNSDCIGDYAPLVNGDILVLEGDFYHAGSKTTLRVPATYIFVYRQFVTGTNGEVVITSEMPAIVETGLFGGSAMNANAIYASAAANSAPVAPYYALSADNYKLIRGDQTISIGRVGYSTIEKRASDYLIGVNSGSVGDYAPLQAGDVLIIQGDFYNKANHAILRVPTTYVFVYKAFDSSNGEVVISATAPAVYESTVPSGSAMNANNIYATATNDAPQVNYQSLKSSNIKLIRNGETFDVAVARGIAIEKTASYNFLKVNADAIGAYAPLQAGDILVYEGDFYNKANNAVIRLPATYVYVYKAYDSSNGEVVITATAPAVYESGVFSGSAMNANNIYATAANDAPTTTYLIAKPENIKLIRNGVTTNVGVVHKAAIEKTASYNFLKVNADAIGAYAPLQAGDILVYEGEFYNRANNAIMRVPATYVYVYKAYDSSNGEVVITSTAPAIVECGALNGSAMNANAVYTTATNDAPTGNYRIIKAENYQLLRDGTTYNLGNVRTTVAIEKTDSWIYLKVNADAIGSYAPLQAGDVLIVKGEFYNKEQNAVLRMQDTYVYVQSPFVAGVGNGTVSITDTMPDLSVPAIEVGSFEAHSNGWTADGIYMSAAENDATYADMNVIIYQSTGVDNIKLVRDGVTTSVAIVDGNAICKFDETGYYLYTNSGVFSSGLPLENQDYLIIEGEFYNPDVEETINVTKTYIHNNHGTMVFSTTEPTVDYTVYVDATITESNDSPMNANAIYAPVLNIDAPVAEYVATSVDNYKLIRNGVTTSIGQVGRSTINKRSGDTLIGTNAWNLGDAYPLQGGDILIVEGQFKNAANETVLNVSTTYFYVYKPYDTSNGAIIIKHAMPAIYESGVLSGNSSNANNIYTTGTNDAPQTTYQALKSSNIKLVRDGVTLDVAVERGVAVEKTSANNFLKPNAAAIGDYAPLQSGDLLIFEGDFYNRSQHIVYRMPATYVYVYGSGGEVVITSSAPAIYESGVLSGNVLNANVVYTTATNNAPIGNYRLMDTASYQLIRDGETINVGKLCNPVIEKNATYHYLKIDTNTLGNGYTLQAGDMLMVKGDFYNKESNAILRVPETYVSVVTAYVSGTNGQVIIRTEDPLKVEVGQLSYKEYSDGTAWHSNGIHFAVEKANAATANSDWSVEYKPSDEACIKLIRDGVTYNVGNTNAGTLIKIDETDYYLKLDADGYTIGGKDAGYMPLVEGDVLVLEGQFIGNAAAQGYSMVVDRTYITFHAPSGSSEAKGGEVIFSTVLNPTVISLAKGNSVTLSASGATWSSSNEALVTVDNGVITAVSGRGTAYITAETASGPVYWEVSLYESTGYGEVKLPSSKKNVNLSVWAGSYHLYTEEHLQRLENAGITTIIGLYRSSEAEMIQILDRLQSHGITALCDLRARNSSGNVTGPWDGTTVPTYWNHPAVAGFLVMDEPCSTEFNTLASLKTTFESLMPGKLFYVNLYPYDAEGERLYGSSWLDYIYDYEDDYINKFVSKVGLDYVSWDSYPLFTDNTIRPNYFLNFEAVTNSGLPAWYTMLSAGHSTSTDTYVTPSEAELRWQMNLAMTYGIQDLAHYVYASHDTTYNYDCMYDINTGTFNETLYSAVTNAGNQVKAWEDIFTSYSWRGVAKVDVGSTNEMMRKLKSTLTLGNSYGLTAVSSDQDMLVGIYELDGSHAYMITNAGSITGSTENGSGAKPFTMTADEDVVLTLSAGSYKCAAVIAKGVITYVPVVNNTVTIDVDAYEGVFVIPVLK